MKITIKSARVNAGLTQLQAAKKLGISKYTLSAWEQGKRYPRLDDMLKLCKLYGVEFSDILIS